MIALHLPSFDSTPYVSLQKKDGVMNKAKIIYFDVDGGRGEAIRLAFHLGNIDFEDDRFVFSEFPTRRKSTPLGQVPVMELSGKTITQSNAILRYVGKLTNLYPSDELEALYCDEIMDAAEDLTDKFVATFGMEGDELKEAREKIVQGPLTRYVQFFESKLQTQGGEFFADHRLTIADLKVAVLMNWLMSGTLDHIPADHISIVAPKVAAHNQRVMQDAVIQSYYQNK